MIRLVPDSTVARISVRKGLSLGYAVIAKIKEHLAAYPGYVVRLDSSDAINVVNEMEVLNEAAGRLADEVQAFRENRRIERAGTPRSRPCCKNCRWFEAVLSAEAHVPATYQAIIEDAGVCVANPPVTTTRNEKGVSVASAFPLVHPTRHCRLLELKDGPEGSVE